MRFFLNAAINLSVPFSSGNSLPKVKVKKVKESMGMIRGQEDILGGHRGRQGGGWFIH